MELNKQYILDDRKFSGEELLQFSGEIAGSGHEEDWRVALFGFIRDFLDEKKRILQSTSGTTGLPKTFELNRSAMIRSAEMTLDYFGLTPGNTALLCLPVDYIAGKMMVVRALVGKLNLLSVKPSGNPMKTFSRQADFAAMVPMQLFETVRNPDKLSLIRLLIVGGGEINQSLMKKVKGVTGTEIFETFAMAETYTHFACRRISGRDPQKYFQSLPGVQLDLDNRGCLVVDIPGITGGPIITNDLVMLQGSRVFEWLGRLDNVINSGGIKINPEILEDKIRKILNINHDLVIIGLPDPKLGIKVVLVLESQVPLADLPADQWINILKEQLTSHEIPREMLTIPELPRNKAMKVLRNELVKKLK